MKATIVSLLLLTTLLCRPAFCGEIHDAAKSGDLEKVKILLKENPELVFSKDKDGATPLHKAASKDVAELLLANKADVNAKDNLGRTPLHEAAMNGHKEVAELLLASKTKVNAVDNGGQTPLHYTAEVGNKELAELLLANEADVNAKDKSGDTPLHAAVESGQKDVAELLRQRGGQDTAAVPQPSLGELNRHPAVRVFTASITWSEIDAIYNLKTKYTDLQKDEYWKQYKGKKVRWSGRVSSVSDRFGSLSLQAKLNPDTFTSDVFVTLKDSQRSKALTLKAGDFVTFTGILERWGSIMPITLSDGEID